jgi:hypothetical protein
VWSFTQTKATNVSQGDLAGKLIPSRIYLPADHSHLQEASTAKVVIVPTPSGACRPVASAFLLKHEPAV